MSIDKKGRKSRASKAGIASGKARHPKSMTERDRNVVLAFKYLARHAMTKAESAQAQRWLLSHGVDLSLFPLVPLADTPYRIIADYTGLTRQRVEQIIKKVI